MADVQVEHGHIRLANRLAEAILAASFSGTQVRILLALIRLTYGWKRKTVRVTLANFAESAGMAYAGGFRRALDELIAAGVVLEVVRPHPGIAGVYAIQKDHEQWGKFSVAAQRLVASWGERPASDDARFDPPPPRDDSAPAGAVPPETTALTGAGVVPSQGQGLCPGGGNSAGDNSANDNDLPARKERKGNERNTTTTTPPPREGDAVGVRALEADIAARLVTAEDRDALRDFVAACPANPLRWLAEIQACLDRMSGHPTATPAQMGVALRDWMLNTPEWSARLFRSYVESAGRTPAGAVAGRGSGSSAFTRQRESVARAVNNAARGGAFVGLAED